MIGGAIGGATATALTDLELTGHLGWNILVGAAEGALAAAVGWGVKGDALSEAGAQGGGSGARRIEQGELRAALKAAVAEYGDDASALGEQEGAHYRLSDAGKAALKPLAEHLGVDLNDIEIKPTGAFGHPAITFGDTIHTDPSFAKENFDQQVDTLAHEMVHTAQYQQLGYVRFFGKYAVDAVSAWFGDYDRYAIPASIAGQNINDVSLTSGASLDAIAERYASEYGVNSRSYR
jgi:hypothetical protein